MNHSLKPVINLEINEMPLEVILDYIKKFPQSQLSKLLKQKRLSLFETIASDIDKEMLYPSQTWASMLSGMSYKKHKCYWYSDPIKKDELLWNGLASNNIKVGILGSLHSSKLPDNLFHNNNYDFYIPDCFSSNSTTKPNIYEKFQLLNNLLVGKSARVINFSVLCKTILSLLLRSIFNPKKYGLSFYSFKQISFLIYKVIKSKNLENLRMAQFPLISSIFLDLISKNLPNYSSLFSNHLAGNMHRYWYAYKIDQFKEQNLYSQNWLKRNLNAIYDPMHLLDDFLKNLMKRKFRIKPIILITASMGQEARPDFCDDPSIIVQIDGKLTNVNLFLDKLIQYSLRKYNFRFNLNYERNMAPQYGFYVEENFEKEKLNLVVKVIEDFIKIYGFKNFKVDRNLKSIVITLSPWHEENVQNKLKDSIYKKSLEDIGFSFYKIEDHHSGSHSRKGVFGIIDSDQNFLEIVNSYKEDNKVINYINFKKIIHKHFHLHM